MTDKTADQGYVKLELTEGIGTISFFHPASNSLPGKILSELAATIENAGVDENIKVIVLKSAGDRAFCAGASFDELIAIQNLDEGKRFFSGFASVINAMRKCPKFIVGRVQGKTVGGGVGLASAVDLCFATKFASVKLSELAIGIGPFVVGPAVERKVGISGMNALAIDATTWKTPEWAKEKGLFAEVFESTEELDEAVNTLSKKLSKSNPDAMRALKEIFWKGTEDWDELLANRAALSGELVLSSFTRDAISAFKNERKSK